MLSTEETRVFGENWISQREPETKLIMNECQSCKKNWFPAKVVCPNCFSDDLVEKDLPAVGEVYSHTTLHVTAKSYQAPLQIAYADFPGDVRVCGQVEGDNLKIGSSVKITFGQISQDSDGTKVYSYKFKIID